MKDLAECRCCRRPIDLDAIANCGLDNPAYRLCMRCSGHRTKELTRRLCDLARQIRDVKVKHSTFRYLREEGLIANKSGNEHGDKTKEAT